MSYEIKSREYHEAEKAAAYERNVKRLDLDVEDCALSSWGDANIARYHELAISLLENGASIGIEGPAAEKWILREGEREVDAKVIDGAYGLVWLLSDAEAAKYGRRFVPFSGYEEKKSRVRSKLGLSEHRELRPCSRYLGSACSCLGAPVHYYAKFEGGGI